MPRKLTRWSQFVAMGMAQLAGRASLRDIVSNLGAQSRKLYRLGVGKVSRSSLARVNAEKPWELYEVRPVRRDDAPRRQPQRPRRLDVRRPAVRHRHERRQTAAEIQRHVRFQRALRLPELRPREHRQAQVDHGRRRPGPTAAASACASVAAYPLPGSAPAW